MIYVLGGGGRTHLVCFSDLTFCTRLFPHGRDTLTMPCVTTAARTEHVGFDPRQRAREYGAWGGMRVRCMYVWLDFLLRYISSRYKMLKHSFLGGVFFRKGKAPQVNRVYVCCLELRTIFFCSFQEQHYL